MCGLVFIESGAAIDSTNGSGLIRVGNPTLGVYDGAVAFDATTSIGSTNPIQTNVATAAADADVGVVRITEVAAGNALSIDQVSTLNGIEATDAITVVLSAAEGDGNLSIDAPVVTSAASKITLTVTNENDLTVGDLGSGNYIQTAGGEIELNAAGGISLTSANSDIRTHTGAGTAGLLDLNADSDTDGAGTFSMTNAGASLSTNAGTDTNIAIDAADFGGGTDILGTIDAGDGVVHLAPTDATGTAIPIAIGADAGNFEVSSAEVNRITAGRIEIGYRADTASEGHVDSGAVSIGEDLAPTGTTVLVINSGSTIQASGDTRTITETSLVLNAVSGIGTGGQTLQVVTTTLAAQVTGAGDMSLTEPTDDIIIGEFNIDNVPEASSTATVSGLSTDDGSIALTTSNGSITVNKDISAGDSGGSGGDTITLIVGDSNQSDGTGASVLTLADNTSITTTDGDITITADRMDFDNTGGGVNGQVIEAGSSRTLTLRQFATTSGGPGNASGRRPVSTQDASSLWRERIPRRPHLGFHRLAAGAFAGWDSRQRPPATSPGRDGTRRGAAEVLAEPLRNVGSGRGKERFHVRASQSRFSALAGPGEGGVGPEYRGVGEQVRAGGTGRGANARSVGRRRASPGDIRRGVR